jgi:hypothetical protein
MADNLNVTTERVYDIPVLLAQAEKVEVPALLDQYFEPHGNWQGISLGWTATVWLAHILSAGDHRLNQVQGRGPVAHVTCMICCGHEWTMTGQIVLTS